MLYSLLQFFPVKHESEVPSSYLGRCRAGVIKEISTDCQQSSSFYAPFFRIYVGDDW